MNGRTCVRAEREENMVKLVDVSPFRGESLVGLKVGLLTVREFAGRCRLKHPYWTCDCECGSTRTISGDSLKRKTVVSCGCYKRTRGLTRGSVEIDAGGNRVSSKEYHAWENILQRCLNPKHQVYHRYGGRGITVCDRWRDSFDAFLEDMGKAPGREYTIGRKNNDDGYYKDNCRWELMRDQCFNKENTRYLTHDGRTQPLTMWSKETGIPISTIRNRIIKGLPVGEALNPDRKHRR